MLTAYYSIGCNLSEIYCLSKLIMIRKQKYTNVRLRVLIREQSQNMIYKKGELQARKHFMASIYAKFHNLSLY
jgi:hypothetical protein